MIIHWDRVDAEDVTVLTQAVTRRLLRHHLPPNNRGALKGAITRAMAILQSNVDFSLRHEPSFFWDGAVFRNVLEESHRTGLARRIIRSVGKGPIDVEYVRQWAENQGLPIKRTADMSAAQQEPHP